jgi:hypothetical protein
MGQDAHERRAEPGHGLNVERRLTRDAAHTIGTEKSRHRRAIRLRSLPSPASVGATSHRQAPF